MRLESEEFSSAGRIRRTFGYRSAADLIAIDSALRPGCRDKGLGVCRLWTCIAAGKVGAGLCVCL